MTIYHITSRTEWESARLRGEYTAPSLSNEGFIHCSTARQILHVANAFYRGRTDLVLLVLDETAARPEVRWEPPAGPPAAGISEADLFPHIFGPVNLECVIRVLDFAPGPDGTFSPPPLE
jgi:uncharacterized protein (DUF952 family)